MKRNVYRIIVRWGVPFLAILFIVLCRYMPALAEGYARTVYPHLSAVLSAFSSLFPFSLEEVGAVVLILWMLMLPLWLRRKGCRWKRIVGREIEILVWVYIWFYFGWGMNYFRYSVYTRLQARPAAYNEQLFLDFLHSYTDSLNASYVDRVEIPIGQIHEEVKSFYQNLPEKAGLVAPKSYQKPKFFMFTPLYSGVGVLGSMGPFFAEAQLNRDLLPVQLPFTYAHEFSHLLGVSSEAEANYWAYRACTESAMPEMKYAGYFGLMSYVASNAARLLSEEQFKEWARSIRPEIQKEYEQRQTYWKGKYSLWMGKVQDVAYNLFLKGNKISSGQKNYAEVVGLLISLQQGETVE